MRVRHYWVKAREKWVKVRDYIRYDLKEIAFPSPLPDPPGSEPEPDLRNLSFQDHLQVWKKACKLYVQSWRTSDIDLDDDDNYGDKQKYKDKDKENAEPELSAMEELALAARAGSENIRPALQRIYMTRATAYRDALRCFIQGYQEGLAEVMSSKDSTTSHNTNDGAQKPKKDESLRDSQHEI